MRRYDPFALPQEKRQKGWFLLALAAFLLLVLAGAQGYVSWAAQYRFVFAAKHASIPAMLEALGLDTGAVIFALLGLAHARMRRNAVIERTLNLCCAAGSMTMNLLSANLGSPRSIVVYVLPAVLYSGCSDRLIATAGAASGVRETSMWRWVGVLALYSIRAVVAFPSTARGVRQYLLNITPLPESGRPVLVTNPEIGDGDDPPALTAAPSSASPYSPRRTLHEVQQEAEAAFSHELARGVIPGIRLIRRQLSIGQARAEKIRAHLESIVDRDDDVPEPSVPIPVVNGAPGLGQVSAVFGQPTRPRQYQDLPTVPVIRE